MLKPRIIPCLDVKDGRVVKGINFVDLVDAGDPVEQAKLYDAQGADELCFLDISASHEGRRTLYDMVEQVAAHCFMPLTVGGGISTLEDIRTLLLAGADKVSINTAAVRNPEFIREAAEKFGSQCITVALDGRLEEQRTEGREQEKEETREIRNRTSEARTSDQVGAQPARRLSANLKYQLFTYGGRRSTGLDAIAWAQKMVEYGAGEILLTSMDRDGTKEGYDIPMTRAIADAVSVPVIASGGVGEPEHFVKGIRDGHASALLAASIFHFGEYTVKQVKQALQQAGIAVRL